jgi:hypothetical protein
MYQPLPQLSNISNSQPPLFPLHKIISQQTQQQFAAIPLTPPAESYGDAMEWSPSQSQLSIPQDSQLLQRSSDTLLGSIDLHRALPGYQPRELSRPPELTGDPPSPSFYRKKSGSSEPSYSAEPRYYEPLAPAKFSMQEDTGLEDIFTSFFSLGNEPGKMIRPRRTSMKPFRAKAALTTPSKDISTHILGLAILTSCFFAWHNEYFSGQIELASLGVTAVFSGLSLFDTLKAPSPYRSYANLLIFFVELAASMLLGQVKFGRAHTHTWDTSGKFLVGVMITQEMRQLYDSITSAKQHGTTNKRSTSKNRREKTQPLPTRDTNPSNPPPNSHETYQSQSQPLPPPPRSFDSLSFGEPKKPLSEPKLFPSFSFGSKPPSSSPFFDPHKPPSLTSSIHPPGADRKRLLGTRGLAARGLGTRARRDSDSDSEYGGLRGRL